MEENKETNAITTRSVGLTFGLYSGAVSVAVFLIVSLLGMNPFGGGLNYIGMVAAIVLLVLAQKKFKDEGDGYMSYGQGFGIGFWSSLVSVTLSMGVTYVYINFVDYGPMQMFLDEQLLKMQESGTPESSIEVAQDWTKRLFWVFGAIGGYIGSLVIVMIVTIFTQKKNAQAEV